jgi:hypothetical protein
MGGNAIGDSAEPIARPQLNPGGVSQPLDLAGAELSRDKQRDLFGTTQTGVDTGSPLRRMSSTR